MAERRERRQRRPKRPGVYLILVSVCAVVAMGAALEAARPAVGAKVLWRGQPQFVAQAKTPGVGPAAH